MDLDRAVQQLCEPLCTVCVIAMNDLVQACGAWNLLDPVYVYTEIMHMHFHFRDRIVVVVVVNARAVPFRRLADCVWFSLY